MVLHSSDSIAIKACEYDRAKRFALIGDDAISEISTFIQCGQTSIHYGWFGNDGVNADYGSDCSCDLVGAEAVPAPQDPRQFAEYWNGHRDGGCLP